jgi:hypothetical protein
MRVRSLAYGGRGTATSPSRKVTLLARATTLDPIVISFSQTVASVEPGTDFGSTSPRMKVARRELLRTMTQMLSATGALTSSIGP